MATNSVKNEQELFWFENVAQAVQKIVTNNQQGKGCLHCGSE